MILNWNQWPQTFVELDVPTKKATYLTLEWVYIRVHDQKKSKIKRSYWLRVKIRTQEVYTWLRPGHLYENKSGVNVASLSRQI